MSLAQVSAWTTAQGVDLDSLVDKVADQFHPEAVVLTGSISRGRGNHLSDIDLLVIGSAAEWALKAVSDIDIGLVVQQHHRIEHNIEVETYAFSEKELRKVREKIELSVSLFSNPAGLATTGIPVLEPATYRALDDVRNGVCLRGQEAFDRFKEDLKLESIPTFVMLLALIDLFVTREDIVGQLERGRPDTALMLIRDAADHLSRAVLASLGEANTRPQWRLHALDERLADVDLDARTQIRKYILTPPADIDQAREEFIRFCAFCDEQLAKLLARSPDVVPALASMSNKIQFKISL